MIIPTRGITQLPVTSLNITKVEKDSSRKQRIIPFKEYFAKGIFDFPILLLQFCSDNYLDLSLLIIQFKISSRDAFYIC